MPTSTAIVESACIATDTSILRRPLEPGGALGLQQGQGQRRWQRGRQGMEVGS